MKEELLKFVRVLILAAAIVAVCIYGIKTFKDLRIKEISAQISYECAQTYRYTQTLPGGEVVSYPMQKEYESCVAAKENLN